MPGAESLPRAAYRHRGASETLAGLRAKHRADEYWHFSADVIEVIESHHEVAAASTLPPLVSLVHLSDLLCRLRDLGYGYYEAMGIDLAGESAWQTLVEHYPKLASMDLARLTMDIDGAMEEVVATVDAVFKA